MKSFNILTFFTAALLVCASTLFANPKAPKMQSTPLSKNAPILGEWTTIDDDTGKAKSIVQIYEKDGVILGKILKLFREASEDQNPKCTKCSGSKKDQQIIGMNIIENMKFNDDKNKPAWEGGTITDPKNGKNYKCKLWTEDGKLKVRGYIAFFFRTQTWVRN